jgi:penicillin-binding protein-related factor A (putative recombinase)
MYNGKILYTLELKSVGTTSISFEKTKEDKGVIHKHQIDKLLEFSKYKNIISGFLFDFRLSDKTYFCMIEEFVNMINQLDKKSFNENDLFKWCNPIKIEKKKMKVNYKYSVEKFLQDTHL